MGHEIDALKETAAVFYWVMGVLLRLPLYFEPPSVPTVPQPEPQEENLPYEWADGEPAERPKTRGECTDIPRPCPFVSCKNHLYWEYLKHHPDAEVWTLKHSCALDAADEGGLTLEEVGELMGLTRERVRQLEAEALRKLKNRRSLQQFASE
jgi:hypothetical protein